MKRIRIIACSAAFLLSGFGKHIAYAALDYSIFDLGTLGGTNSYAYSINFSGEIAGSSELVTGDSTQHAIPSGPNGGAWRDLGTLGDANSFARYVNGSGQVGGSSYLMGNNAVHAYLSEVNGGMLRDLGTLGDTNSSGYGVNSTGQVTGESGITGNSAIHAFLTGTNGGALHDLALSAEPAASASPLTALFCNENGRCRAVILRAITN